MTVSVKTDFSYTYIRPGGRTATYHTKLLHVDEGVVVMLHPKVQPSRTSIHFGEEILGRDYDLLWFLFNHEPFDAARFYRPDGTLTGYYVDVLEPVHWNDADARSLQPITDLFLDLWIHPDGRYLVLDRDELDDARARGFVTQEQYSRALAVLSGLVKELERGDFPPAIVKSYPWPA